MAKVIKMPVLGNSVEEVRIVQWFKKEGDVVAPGEPLAEVETDKTSMEWESPEGGVLRRILAAADTYVKVEAPVAIFGTADEDIDGSPLPLPPSPSEGQGGIDAGKDNAIMLPSPPILPHPSEGQGRGLSPRARRKADELGVDMNLLTGRGTGPQGRVQEKDVLTFHAALEIGARAEPETMGRGLKASPLARAVAADAGLDLSGVLGSGMGGRITAGDVRGVAPTPGPSPSEGRGEAERPSAYFSPLPSEGEGPGVGAAASRTITLTGLRKRVADNLVKSVRNAPHVTLNTSADMTEAMRLRGELLPGIEKATGVRLSPTDIIVKACAVALREHPGLNAHIDGDTITLFDDVHIGLAVSLGDDGLIVPVIRDARRKGLSDIARDRSDLAARARAGKLGTTDVTNGTFTVTNLGNYGIASFNPIIAPPQVAILGVGAIADTIVARNGAPAVRPMMGLSLSFDHRAMDGAPAAAFLARLREILESPYLLLL